MIKTLIIATSHKTRGGITSVINAHKKASSGKNIIANG